MKPSIKVEVALIIISIFFFTGSVKVEAGQAQAYFSIEQEFLGTDVRDHDDILLDGTGSERDLLQIIFTGPNGEIDPPDLSNPHYISRHDSLLRNANVGDDELMAGGIGDGEFTLNVFSPKGDNPRVYIRAWDASDLSSASFYGETAPYQLVGPPSPPADYYPPSFSTDKEKCDKDGDTYLDEDCGGDDCDDTDPLVYPGYPESAQMGNCDDGKDNDCDGMVDTDPECTPPCSVLPLPNSHSPTALYLIPTFVLFFCMRRFLEK